MLGTLRKSGMESVCSIVTPDFMPDFYVTFHEIKFFHTNDDFTKNNSLRKSVKPSGKHL